MKTRFAAFFAAVLILAGCSGQTAAPTAAPPAFTKAPTATAAPAPTPAFTQTPEPTPAPTPAPVIGQVKLNDEGSVLYARTQPDAGADAAGLLAHGVQVRILEALDGWYAVDFDGQTLYASADYIDIVEGAVDPDPAGCFYYLRPASGMELVDDPTGAKDEAGEPLKVEKKVKDELVDVRRYVPHADIVMIFSSPDNFTGKAYYSQPVCLLQKSVALKLQKAEARFRADGYTLRIYDAYRPRSVQYQLFEFVGRNTRYIADPERGSTHNRGAAVDVTLLNAQGNEIEMPSGMHVMDETAGRKSKTMTAEAKANMDYLTNVMLEAGFALYVNEWWHYQDPKFADFMLTSYDLDNVLPCLFPAA